MFKSSIVLKMNGSTDALVIDGFVFDRSAMTPSQRRGLRDVVKDALFPGWSARPASVESRAPRKRNRKGAR